MNVKDSRGVTLYCYDGLGLKELSAEWKCVGVFGLLFRESNSKLTIRCPVSGVRDSNSRLSSAGRVSDILLQIRDSSFVSHCIGGVSIASDESFFSGSKSMPKPKIYSRTKIKIK